MFDEIKQYVEGLAPQVYLLLASPKLGVLRIEAKRREEKLPVAHVLTDKSLKITSIA